MNFLFRYLLNVGKQVVSTLGVSIQDAGCKQLVGRMLQVVKTLNVGKMLEAGQWDDGRKERR